MITQKNINKICLQLLQILQNQSFSNKDKHKQLFDFLKEKLGIENGGIDELKGDKVTFSIPLPNNYFFWVNCDSSKQLFFESPQFSMVLEVITENLSKQTILTDSKKYADWIFEFMQEGVLIINEQGEIQFMNKQMQTLIGYDMEEAKSKNVWKILAAINDKSKVQKQIAKRKKGISSTYEALLKHKKGHYWWGKISASPILNPQGKTIGTIAIIENIDNKKKQSHQISYHKNRLQKIIETSPDAFFVMTNDANIKTWNCKAESIFGFTKAESIGKKLHDLIIPKGLEEIYFIGINHFEQTQDSSIIEQRIETVARRKSGEEFPIELVFTPLENNAEEQEYFAFARDITQRKKDETELLKAKKTAENAQKIERQFLANMSHEIRTPMNAVVGMVHLLQRTNPSEEQKEYINTLLFSANSLLRIISDILDLSKIESGKIEFDQQQFSLGQLAKSLQEALSTNLNKDVRLVLEDKSNLEHLVAGDYTRLSQILTNLLGNAIKFTLEGEIVFRIKPKKEENKQLIIHFEIEDTGIGMTQKELESIFLNFKQANTHTHTKFGGTGLGLPIVKRLIELQNGQINVESAPNKGTLFSFFLPFGKTNTPDIPPKPETEIISAESLQGIRILVAEDNLTNQKLISKVLEIWACDFLIVNNGKEALNISLEKEFDIFLLDMHMPIMDGYELIKQLRNIKHHNQNKPIVALTAAALVEEKNLILKIGANEFVTKPFIPKQLQKIILKNVSPITKNAKKMNVQPDLSYLRELSGDDTDFIKEILETFLEEAPKDCQSLEEYIQNKDAIQTSKISHKFKSSLQMLGLSELKELAFELEQEGKETPKTDFFDRANLFLSQIQKSIPNIQTIVSAM